MRSNFQQIKLYCLDLSTQNLGLREVDLEPSSKRGVVTRSTCRNKEETPKRKRGVLDSLNSGMCSSGRQGTRC